MVLRYIDVYRLHLMDAVLSVLDCGLVPGLSIIAGNFHSVDIHCARPDLTSFMVGSSCFANSKASGVASIIISACFRDVNNHLPVSKQTVSPSLPVRRCVPGGTTRVREKKSGTPGGAMSARTGSCVSGTRCGSSAARRKE